MKFITVALLFVAIGSSIAAPGYVKLSIDTVNESQLIQDLRQLGAEYTLQQGIFRNTQAPLKNGDWNIDKTEGVYRRIDNAVNYYKYTVILKSNSSPTIVRATYELSFRSADGDTLVTFYQHKILCDRDVYITDLPQFYDTRIIVSNPYYSGKLQQGYDFTIANAIAQGQIRDATYHIGTIFSAGDYGYTFPVVLNFLVTLVTEDGYTYRARIAVPDLYEVPEEEQGNYPITYVIYPNN